MLKIIWLITCAAPDVILTLAVLEFGTPSALLSWSGVLLLIALPTAVGCLAWWVILSSGLVSLLPAILLRIEWRVSAILIATFMSIAATLIGFAVKLHDETFGFTKDVFAGWVGSVAFFGLVGLVVSVVSLSDAAADTFPGRVRVLVRGNSGPHIDDFTERLRTSLAHYAASVKRELTIIDYDSGMYLLRVDVETVIKSFVDDIDTVYASAVSYKPDHPPPQGKFHRLIKVTGVDCETSPIESGTSELIAREYRATVPRRGSCKVSITLGVWVKAGSEAITYSPIRYSLSTGVTIDHELKHDLRIRSKWLDEAETPTILRAGTAGYGSERANLKQGGRVHTLFIEPP